jgi:hypothetical protein
MLEHILAPKHLMRRRADSPEQKKPKLTLPKPQCKKTVTPRDILLRHKISLKKQQEDSVSKKFCAKYVQI